MKIDQQIQSANLMPKIKRLWELSGQKIRSIERTFDPAKGSPVFTVRGKYTVRGWTEWTQGFSVGAALLQFDATDEAEFLELGREQTVRLMAPHVSHVGVHDHGFNNISTYGNLLRLMAEGRIAENPWKRAFYELALKLSGAIQARRWTPIADGGFIYSFNGPHSLFVDTIRSLRVLALSHQLGHVLMEENDRHVSLLDRLKAHALATAKYCIYYGKGRDAYDLPGRTAHESIFNINDGNYRCASSQQGYSAFSTWTRGLAWAMCGFAELLEFMRAIGDNSITAELRKAAEVACDFYIRHATASDGIPYWDTGAPKLHLIDNWQLRPADPFNSHEPVDSSAAAIAAQGLLRLGRHLKNKRYWQAGLTVLNTLFDEPYISADAKHQGLILHSVYHRPNGWDFVPRGRAIPCGESSMWGDYHAREAALYVQRIASSGPYLKFFL
ncbi:MAG TPA: glycosyl hydrolase [Verrucomicrobiae bacterium]|jgi:hypothetical protein